MKFSLCIEPIFENVDFYDRIKLAKECGADAIEFWNPIPYDTNKIGQLSSQLDIPVAAISIADSWNVRMNDSYRKVLHSVEETIRYGKEVGCSTFIGLSGEQMSKVDAEKSILIENLKRVSELCEKHGVTIVLEPLNSLYDHKGYYLDSSYVGFEIAKAVNSPNISILYDCYHMQLMEGNLINNMVNNVEFIGHIHSAGVPGRKELQNCEINYPAVVKAVEQAGYQGYFGLEYWTTYDDAQSVRDVLAYLRS